jgi:type IV fimbrial biogenesis protein FimT
MHTRVHGFTLLELMTSIAVLGVLLAIGVPAFSTIIRNNQIAAESGNLVSALMLARSEALTRGIRVSVCAAADEENCAATADWSRGWIVFADDFGAAGVLNDSDEPLQYWPAPADGVSINTTALAVTFSRTARAELPVTFNVSKADCTGDQRREINVDRSGRVRLQRVTCSPSAPAPDPEVDEADTGV